MEYLQYIKINDVNINYFNGFKPYYKWNTFNTDSELVIKYWSNGGFKPYYKWNTFNTAKELIKFFDSIGFKPYYKWNTFNTDSLLNQSGIKLQYSFKPYYKWNTFNTYTMSTQDLLEILKF